MQSGITGSGRLQPCPKTPNCVCSDDDDPAHAIEPLEIRSEAQSAWTTLVAHLKADPSMTIVEERDGYLRAEARTRWLRFVDDVELRLRPDRNQIAMRSASRVGYSDLGTNRRRLEKLRNAVQHLL